MTTLATGAPSVASATAPASPTIALSRRTIDTVLSASGAVVAVVLLAAGALLMWGSTFASDYVHDELASQHVSFPSAEELRTQGRADLAKWGGQRVDSGREAQAYASFINGHLKKIGGGATFADLSGPQNEAKAAVEAARTSGASEATIASLQAKADTITGQRTTLFQGETLRGLLLSAYAWSSVGMIAGIASLVAIGAGLVMVVLVALGVRHQRRMATAR
jgi:hypothetical protein